MRIINKYTEKTVKLFPIYYTLLQIDHNLKGSQNIVVLAEHPHEYVARNNKSIPYCELIKSPHSFFKVLTYLHFLRLNT